mgnify:CR=1 FL=1
MLLCALVPTAYILKSDTRLEFVTAIRNITHGNAYISPSFADRVINGYLKAQVGAPRRQRVRRASAARAAGRTV